jgi:hypothetical protein
MLTNIKQLENIETLINYIQTEKTNDLRFVVFDSLGIEEAEKLSTISDIALQNYNRMIDNYGIIHALNEHGNGGSEVKRGQLAIDINDFLLVPLIVKSPDLVRYEFDKFTKRHLLIYEKVFTKGKFLYIEEIRIGRKQNMCLKSLRLYKTKTS